MDGYGLLSEKALVLLEEIALKKDNWLKNNLLNNPGEKPTLKIIRKFLRRNTSIYVKLEIIEVWEYLLKNDIIICDKHTASAFIYTLVNIGNDQPWIVFKKAVDVIGSCQYIREDKKLLSKIVKKIMEYIEASTSTCPSVKEYLMKVLESLNVEKKLDKDIVEEYIEKYSKLKK